MKKICFVSQFPPPIHGLSKAVDTLYNSNLSKIYELEKVNITNNKLILKNIKKIKKSDADIFYITISQSVMGNLRDILLLRHILKKKKKCIIHLHGGYYKKMYNDDFSNLQKFINRKIFSKIDIAIVLGASLKNMFDEVIDKNKIRIVHNCVDETYINESSVIQNKIDNFSKIKTKKVLYLSNFIKSKGYLEILKMAKWEKENNKDNKFLNNLNFEFAGKFFDETSEKTFFSFIEENNLEDIVRYHGVVDGEKKKQLLADCHFFCLISRYPKEGQPISIIEAMANGDYVVTTDHSGIPDLITNENGIVKRENDDLKDIYYKIKNCTFSEYANVCQTNRQKVREDFSQKKYIEDMIKIFEDV